jgi:hypothetical protein
MKKQSKGEGLGATAGTTLTTAELERGQRFRDSLINNREHYRGVVPDSLIDFEEENINEAHDAWAKGEESEQATAFATGLAGTTDEQIQAELDNREVGPGEEEAEEETEEGEADADLEEEGEDREEN